MKPKFFLLALLAGIISLSSFAQKSAPTEPQTAIRFSENFTSLIIENELNVVLTDGTSNEITIDGDAKAVESRVVDGQLYLAVKEHPSKSQLTVYVPANGLSKVFLNGSASLRSAGVLSNAKLNILLGAEAKINVRSTGIVKVDSVDEIRFVQGR